MDYVCAKRLSVNVESGLIYSLTKDIIDVSIYDTILINYMPENSHKTKSYTKKSVSDFHNSCNVKERKEFKN